jgi:dodecin
MRLGSGAAGRRIPKARDKNERHERPKRQALNARKGSMEDNIYKVVEVVGSSTESIQQAVRNAVSKASETIRNVEWVEVGQVRGHVVDGELEHFQVVTKIGFRLE